MLYALVGIHYIEATMSSCKAWLGGCVAVGSSPTARESNITPVEAISGRHGFKKLLAELS